MFLNLRIKIEISQKKYHKTDVEIYYRYQRGTAFFFSTDMCTIFAKFQGRVTHQVQQKTVVFKFLRFMVLEITVASVKIVQNLS